MKLLILGYELSPVGGGAGQALANLLRGWKAEKDLEIEVWTAQPPQEAPREFPENVIIREFPCGKRGLHYWRTSEMLRLLWKTWRRSLGDDPFPDAVLVWGGWPLGLLLLTDLGQDPSIIALRGSDVPGFNRRTSGIFWPILARIVWKRAKIVTANSPALAKLANQTAPDLNIELVPNGVTIQTSRPACDTSGDRQRKILTVSRLIPRKRVDWILQAYSLLAPEIRKQWGVVIAGDGPEKYRLQACAKELGIHDRIDFIGEVQPEHLSEVYSSSGLFVLASSAEGLSNALLEAMSFGLPCLNAFPTGYEDIDGAVIDFKSVKGLAGKIERLFRNPDRYAETARQCRTVAGQYTWEAAADRYLELVKEAARHN